MPQSHNRLRDIFDGFARGFASAVTDARHKVLEEPWFSKVVTPRAQTLTITTPGNTPGERENWFDRFFGRETQGAAREQDAREPSREQSQDRDR